MSRGPCTCQSSLCCRGYGRVSIPIGAETSERRVLGPSAQPWRTCQATKKGLDVLPLPLASCGDTALQVQGCRMAQPGPGRIAAPVVDLSTTLVRLFSWVGVLPHSLVSPHSCQASLGCLQALASVFPLPGLAVGPAGSPGLQLWAFVPCGMSSVCLCRVAGGLMWLLKTLHTGPGLNAWVCGWWAEAQSSWSLSVLCLSVAPHPPNCFCSPGEWGVQWGVDGQRLLLPHGWVGVRVRPLTCSLQPWVWSVKWEDWSRCSL